jgi:hypothetical protein
VADDTRLPTGARLGELLNERLDGRLDGYVAPDNVQDLIAVADAAVVPMGGLEALQGEVLELADFKGAPPNYGHQALALLLAEGAATALSWNWDTCIERATPAGEMLEVASTRDEMVNLDRPQLAKVHGCATMRRTLLITSGQLADAPIWTDQAFAERIRGSEIVFIGIGDVADYAQRRIRELMAEFSPPDVRIVSTRIRSEWAGSVWASVLPSLAVERRIQTDADTFLDGLARAWARELLDGVKGRAGQLRDEVENGVAAVVDALGQLSSVDVIRWCRASVMGSIAGVSAVRAPATGDAVLAAGVLASRSDGLVTAPRPACCEVDGKRIEVLTMRDRMVASDVQREARRRAQQLRSSRDVNEAELHFLVGGTVLGRLEQEALDLIAGEADPLDVIDGPFAARITYLSAPELLQDAA